MDSQVLPPKLSRPQLPPLLDLSSAAASAAPLAPLSSISISAPPPLFAPSSSLLSPPAANSNSAAASTSTSPAGPTFCATLPLPPPLQVGTGSNCVSAPVSPRRNSRATGAPSSYPFVPYESAAPITAPPTSEYAAKHAFWDNVMLPPLHEHLRHIQQDHHYPLYRHGDAESEQSLKQDHPAAGRRGSAGSASACQDFGCGNNNGFQELPRDEYRAPHYHQEHWEQQPAQPVYNHEQHLQRTLLQQQHNQMHVQDNKVDITHQQHQQQQQEQPPLHQLHHHSYRRFKPSAQHLALLTSVFAKNAFPSRALRDKLARLFGVESKQVQVWFQNRRQMAKRVASTSTSSSTPASPAEAGSSGGGVQCLLAAPGAGVGVIDD
ncbi:hypothetical protein HDU84_001202 [Entophlyctis sp. JEL0112]|nr:hypothetical protein HDU84_001202 [Entophlyctis sp. JEL0112]